MKHITITSTDRIALVSLRHALRMAHQSNGRMHLTRPSFVRNAAKVWLGKVGVEVTSRTRWATLHSAFESTFGAALDTLRREESEGEQGVAV